jgi:hypothetical protein
VKLSKIILMMALVILLDSVLLGLYSIDYDYSHEKVILGTADALFRTGGRLQDPPLDEFGFPLSSNITSPGNRSFSGITEMMSFSIFHQVAIGRNLLDETVQSYREHTTIPGARYEFRFNFTSWIIALSDLSTEVHMLDNLRNMLINESTIQVRSLSKNVDLLAYDNDTLEVLFLLTTANGVVSQNMTHTITSFTIPFLNSLNLTIQAEWDYQFIPERFPALLFNGNESLARFQINGSESGTGFGLSGYFRCYYLNEWVAVYGLRLPFAEIGILILAVIVILVYHRSNVKHKGV